VEEAGRLQQRGAPELARGRSANARFNAVHGLQAQH